MIHFGLFLWCLFVEEGQGHHHLLQLPFLLSVMPELARLKLSFSEFSLIWATCMCRFQTKAQCELRGLSHDRQLLPVE